MGTAQRILASLFLITLFSLKLLPQGSPASLFSDAPAQQHSDAGSDESAFKEKSEFIAIMLMPQAVAGEAEPTVAILHAPSPFLSTRYCAVPTPPPWLHS